MDWMIEFVKDHGDIVLKAGAIIGLAVAFARWVGKKMAGFVNDTVLPAFTETKIALNQLTGSVEHLSVRTHENTAAIEAMSQDQQKVNIEHATAIAKLQGKAER
jgi:hypothetical protein